MSHKPSRNPLRRNLFLILTSSVLSASFLFLAACGSSSHPISVTSTVPATGATGVSTTAPIQITFSSAANPNTVNSTNIQVTDAAQNPVAGTVTFNSSTNTATFTPTAALAANTTYTVTVTAVSSSGGGSMTAAYTSTFTTAASSTATTQYQAPLFSNPTSAAGEISLDTSGTVTVQLTAATASTTFTVQFCPAAAVDSSVTYSCFTVGTVTSDGSGNANTTMTFPQSGSWAGDFQLLTGTTVAYSTTIEGTGSSQTYLSQLEPSSTVNGQGLGSSSSTSQDPLTSGNITIASGAIQFTLTGALPNTAYSAGECSSVALGNSSCYALYNSENVASFTSDANGNVTFSVTTDNASGDMLQVGSSNSTGFIGGFTVP